jgi:anti-sigma-K factor RskA
MIEEQKEEQACLYALGALSRHETLEFANELTSDRDLQQFVGALQNNLQALALNVRLHSPPPELKEKVLARIQALPRLATIGPQPAPRIESGGFPYWLPWSLAACLGVLCIILMTQTQSMQQKAESLQPRIDQLRKERDDLQRQIAALKSQDDLSQMRITVLRSLVETSPKSLAVSLWGIENGTGLFMAEDLAPLPGNQVYQLWLLDKQNNPISGGTFNVDKTGRARFPFKLASPATPEKFAVTVEPKGGVQRTKGPMILLGQSR